MAGGVPPALADTARAQHDVVSREQALAAGMTVSALWHRVRPGGAWRPVVPGVYLTYAGTPAGPQREMAALLHAGPGSVITGGTALARHGLRVPRTETIDVLVPASRIRRSTGFVRIQRSARMPRQTWADGPLVYTLPARAVADLARGLTDRGEVQAVVADALRGGRCTVAELAAELDQGPVRGSALLRRVLAELPDRAGPAAGVRPRDLIKPALPRPVRRMRPVAATG
jgi:hypothetical protein